MAGGRFCSQIGAFMLPAEIPQVRVGAAVSAESPRTRWPTRHEEGLDHRGVPKADPEGNESDVAQKSRLES